MEEQENGGKRSSGKVGTTWLKVLMELAGILFARVISRGGWEEGRWVKGRGEGNWKG